MIARVSCQGTEDQLTVQFGVLKKVSWLLNTFEADILHEKMWGKRCNTKKVTSCAFEDVNASMIPYKVEHFIDADNLATRMKAMGHLNKIADLDVESIEFVS